MFMFQLLFLSSNLRKSKNSYMVGRGRGGGVMTNFQPFVPEFKFAKTQKSSWWGEEGVHDDQFPIFVPEFKFAKIQKSLCGGGGGS